MQQYPFSGDQQPPALDWELYVQVRPCSAALWYTTLHRSYGDHDLSRGAQRAAWCNPCVGLSLCRLLQAQH